MYTNESAVELKNLIVIQLLDVNRIVVVHVLHKARTVWKFKYHRWCSRQIKDKQKQTRLDVGNTLVLPGREYPCFELSGMGKNFI